MDCNNLDKREDIHIMKDDYFKSTLEIHKYNDEYVIKDLVKGELFRSKSGDECLEYLVTNHKGEVPLNYCRFETSYGTPEGSEDNPRTIVWH